jgi:hypothetical protein
MLRFGQAIPSEVLVPRRRAPLIASTVSAGRTRCSDPPTSLSGADDAEALREAHRLPNGPDLEVWEDARLVHRLRQARSPDAARSAT